MSNTNEDQDEKDRLDVLSLSRTLLGRLNHIPSDYKIAVVVRRVIEFLGVGEVHFEDITSALSQEVRNWPNDDDVPLCAYPPGDPWL